MGTRPIKNRGPSKSDSALSAKKRVLFSILSLALPLAILALIEIGLRLGGYGEYPPLFKPVPGYEDYLQPEEGVASRYFTSIENIPGIPFDSFLKEKDPDGLRIFVQGGSTAAGFPFYFGGSFPDMLEQRLLMTFPGRSVEVINTAMAAVNSYTLLDFTDEILEHKPDAILIYAGHNEYYGALGVGSSQLLGTSPALVNLYLKLKRFRTMQLLQSALSRIVRVFSTTGNEQLDGTTLMQNMIGEQRIPFESDLYSAGLDQFSFNLNQLLKIYRDADVPVFIGTLGSNERDHPPFLSGSHIDADANQIESDINAARRLFVSGDSVAAISAISTVIDSNPKFASALYVRGQMMEASGSVDEARRDFQMAREYDELRFRAPEALNQIIRDAASVHGAVLVESENAIRAASPDQIVGSEMMLEHLHPTIRGYFVLADAFYDVLSESGLGSDSGWDRVVNSRIAESNLLVTPLDSLVGAYRVQQLTSVWPFKPAGTRQANIDTLGAGTPVGQLALRLYQRDIRRIDALDELQQQATRVGDFVIALQSVFAIIQRYPFLPGPYLSAANIQTRIGRYEEAEQYVLASLERGDSAEGRQILGSLLLNKNLPEAAIPQLEQALILDPNDLGARYNLAGALALTNRFEEARTHAQIVVDRQPENQAARQLLESLPR